MVMGHDARQAGYDSDRFEIIRTVEMESFSEDKLANRSAMGHGYDISTEPRAISLETDRDFKQPGVVVTSATSDHSPSSPSGSRSSAPASRETDSPFADHRTQ